MKSKRLALVLILLPALFWGVGGAIAQDPEPAEQESMGSLDGPSPQALQPRQVPPDEGQPQQDVSVTATVSSRISYQGILREGGRPVTGSRSMAFGLYSDGGCTVLVQDLGIRAVSVTNGLFTEVLDVDQSQFNGQRLWLKTSVGGTDLDCLEILPAPYALSLRPDADVFGAVPGGSAIFAYNQATSGLSYGLRGDSDSTNGRGISGWARAVSGNTYGVYGASSSTLGIGVYGTATAGSGQTYGVYGISSSKESGSYGGYFSGYGGVYGRATGADEAGVYAYNDGAGPELVLGSSVGRIYSDPDIASSDIQIASNDYFEIKLDSDGDGEDADFYIRDKDSQIIFQVDESGFTSVGVLEIRGGADLAEPFESSTGEPLEPGMVVAIDPLHPGQLLVADRAYDRTVAGCVSGANGINPGLTMQQQGLAGKGAFPVALSGRVYCWADASAGPIGPGDMLTTSDTPGHGMKVSDQERAQGAILGKAMSSLAQGKGLVLVLVTLQ
jgi:hypothetical protein